MKVKKKHRNASDSEDDVPLVSASNGTKSGSAGKHMALLLRMSVEKCEFCEEVFFNKFNLLVHNATHIIIPLIKQITHKCTECQHHFTSIEALEWHTINKHPNITKEKDYVPELLQSFVKREPTIIVRTPDVINDSIIKKESVLKSLLEKEPIVLLKNENFVIEKEKDNPVIYEISDDSMSVKSDEGNTEHDSAKLDIECVNKFDLTDNKGYFEYEENAIVDGNSTPIKERIRFEDDTVNANGIINDLTLCAVNLETFDNNWINSIQNPSNAITVNNGIKNSMPIWKNPWQKNAIILGKYPTVDSKNWESVHYEDLINTGDYKCSRCTKNFPSRYDAIIHETKHAKIKPRKLPFLCRLCDWYFPPNPHAFRAHLRNKHVDDEHDLKSPLGICSICNLKYVSYRRHMKNYHANIPPAYKVEVLEYDDTGLNVVDNFYDESKWNTAMIKLCNICYSFCKEKPNLKYKYCGEFNEVGVRHPCEKCQKQCFTLKLVKRKFRKPIRVTNTMDILRQREPFVQQRKTFTNRERLKNVHQRLKKLKILNRF